MTPVGAKARLFTGLLCAWVVGAFFLVSGFLKVAEPQQFLSSILAYELTGLETSRLVMQFVPPLEILLGTLALTGLFRRWAVLGIIGLLAFVFMPAVGYAWVNGTAENCGCLGELVKRTPGETLVEDTVLIGIGLLSLYFLPAKLPGKLGAGTIARGIVSVIVPLLGLMVHVKAGAFEPIQKGPLAKGVFIGDLQLTAADSALPPDGKEGRPDVSLLRGDQFVMFFSVTCPHCQHAVPEVNKLVEAGDLPPIIGICPDVQDPTDFIEQLGPKYPIIRAGKDDFMRLLNRVPRFALVRNGTVVRVFLDLPTADAIRRAVKGEGGTE
jgi:uncharacterized membrane protein YphA (DoxX/SURF4 family)